MTDKLQIAQKRVFRDLPNDPFEVMSIENEIRYLEWLDDRQGAQFNREFVERYSLVITKLHELLLGYNDKE